MFQRGRRQTLGLVDDDQLDQPLRMVLDPGIFGVEMLVDADADARHQGEHQEVWGARASGSDRR
jgi:hypothetical protein